MSSIILPIDNGVEQHPAGRANLSPAEFFLTVSSRDSSTLNYLFRRALGVILALALLILLAPLLLLISILIRIDSPGPAIYMQQRVGSRRRRTRSGQIVWEVRTFTFYKFRSMKSDADPSLHREFIQLFCQGQIGANEPSGANFKLKNDSRVTRVGRFLRRSSLDELAQLFNVLKGDMTLVGPRPVPQYEVAQYDRVHYERFAALAGITGLWQVRGRGRVPFEEMIRMDIEYVRNCSPWLDLKILYSTVPAVLRGHGAC